MSESNVHKSVIGAASPIHFVKDVPPTFPYGMCELTIRDPDGNRITFAASTDGDASDSE